MKNDWSSVRRVAAFSHQPQRVCTRANASYGLPQEWLHTDALAHTSGGGGGGAGSVGSRYWLFSPLPRSTRSISSSPRPGWTPACATTAAAPGCRLSPSTGDVCGCCSSPVTQYCGTVLQCCESFLPPPLSSSFTLRISLENNISPSHGRRL